MAAFQEVLNIRKERYAQCEDFLDRCRKFQAEYDPQRLQEESQRVQDELTGLHESIHDATKAMQREQQKVEEAQHAIHQLQNDQVTRQAKVKGEPPCSSCKLLLIC